MELNQCLLLLVIFAGSITAQLDSRCVTPNQEQATCIKLNDCSILSAVLSNHGRPKEQTRFLLQSQCGSIGKIILICCGSFDNFRQAKAKAAQRFKFNDNLLPSRSMCGRQVSGSRIIGGTEAGIEEYPWMALIEYEKFNRSVGYSCGGSLINSRYILTAAHCVIGEIVRRVGKPYRVRLGEHDTTKGIDCQPDSGCGNPPLDVDIEDTIPHSEYDDSDKSRQNDIAVLRLVREVLFTEFIRPICLPTETDVTEPDDRLFIAGWGKTGNVGATSTVKLKTTVPIVRQTDCVEKFQKIGAVVTRKQICAGGEAGKDSCQGDSGGPLMNTVSGNANIWYAEGIVSFGVRCGAESWPGVYTRILEYVDWIKGNIRE